MNRNLQIRWFCRRPTGNSYMKRMIPSAIVSASHQSSIDQDNPSQSSIDPDIESHPSDIESIESFRSSSFQSTWSEFITANIHLNVVVAPPSNHLHHGEDLLIRNLRFGRENICRFSKFFDVRTSETH